MSILRSIATKFYRLRMKISKQTGLGIGITTNKMKIDSPESFYSLVATSNSGEVVNFEEFRGKKILLVNLASQCGFTPQYKELEQLYRQDKDEITILGFPSNDLCLVRSLSKLHKVS